MISILWIDDEIGETINIFQLFSHAHRLNTEFKIYKINQDDSDYKELIYISYDWEHPPIMKFDPPMYFNMRDGIEMEATYYNYTDEAFLRKRAQKVALVRKVSKSA